MRIGISGYVGNCLTGIGRVLICVIQELARKNPNDVYIIFHNYDFKDYDFLDYFPNIKLVEIPYTKESGIKNIIWHQWLFQKLLKQYRCDISYIPNFTLLLWKRIPTIVTIHDLIEFNVPNKFSKLRMVYRKIIDPLMVKNSSYITTVSECSKQDIIKFCNARENKILVIPNATDRSRFKLYDQNFVEQCIKKYNLSFKNYFLFVGTIDYPGKNIMSALKAYVDLKKKYNVPEKMVVVGKRGFNSNVIYDYVNSSNYKDDIIFTGYITDKDLPLIYSGAKVMLYLSYYEGFGLPVLEAMSCGIPVICSNTSCFPEVYDNVNVGVSPTSIAEIRSKLYKLSTDDRYNKEIAMQCYKRAEMFSWEKSANLYYQIFHRYEK